MHLRTLIVSLIVPALLVPAVDVWCDTEPSIEVDVTFSATRTEELATDVAATSYTIDREQIERSQADSVIDLLQTLPGVYITENGGFGGAASIINRGANTNQTLILIDGVRVNNPMLGGADLANLTLDQVGRIEVVKGPMSSMWGADAMAGVVQIFTASGAQIDNAVRLGAGNYGTTRGDFAWGTGQGRQSFGITGSWMQTDGVRDNSDYDGFTIAARLDQPLAGGTLTLTGRYYDYDLGVPGPTTWPTPNDRQNSTAMLGSLTWMREGLSSRDTIRLGYWNEEIDYNYTDFTNTAQNSVGEPTYFEAGWQHDWIGEISEITLGAEVRRTEGDFSDTALGAYSADNDAVAGVAQIQYRPGDWRFVAAARWQDDDLFGDETTWRVGATRLFQGGRSGVWANYATGYRVPTFNELYFPGSGNTDLMPEKSKSWEIGVFDSTDDALLEMAYFHNDFENLIEWREVEQFVWRPVNIADAVTEGVELSVRRNHGDRWFERYSVSKLHWWSNGDPLLRRPDWTAGYTLGYHDGRTQAQLDFIYVGDRLDAVSFPGPDEVASYYLVNVGARHDLGGGIEVWVRANNILDEQYESAANYPAPEFNFIAGLSTAL